MRIRSKHISTISSSKIAEASGGSVLWTVNINTAGSGAILKIYNNTSAVSADLVAQIDASTLGSYTYGIFCEKGIYYDLSVAAADITIGYA